MSAAAEKRSWLASPGLVLSMIALCIALGGHAFALGGRHTVKAADIAPDAVTAKTFATNAVTTTALADRGVGARQNQIGSIDGADLVPGSLDTSQLAAGSVGGIQLKLPHVVSYGSVQDPDSNLPVDYNWNGSGTSGHSAICGNDELRLAGGIVTAGGNQRGFLQSSVPSLAGNVHQWDGGTSSDAGGASTFTVYALCLG